MACRPLFLESIRQAESIDAGIVHQGFAEIGFEASIINMTAIKADAAPIPIEAVYDPKRSNRSPASLGPTNEPAAPPV